jgi:hypothetical protein
VNDRLEQGQQQGNSYTARAEQERSDERPLPTEVADIFVSGYLRSQAFSPALGIIRDLFRAGTAGVTGLAA